MPQQLRLLPHCRSSSALAQTRLELCQDLVRGTALRDVVHSNVARHGRREYVPEPYRIVHAAVGELFGKAAGSESIQRPRNESSVFSPKSRTVSPSRSTERFRPPPRATDAPSATIRGLSLEWPPAMPRTSSPNFRFQISTFGFKPPPYTPHIDIPG